MYLVHLIIFKLSQLIFTCKKIIKKLCKNGKNTILLKSIIVTFHNSKNNDSSHEM